MIFFLIPWKSCMNEYFKNQNISPFQINENINGEKFRKSL